MSVPDWRELDEITELECPRCGETCPLDDVFCGECHARLLPVPSLRATRLDDDRSFPMSGREQATYGCIVSFENENGKRLVIHRGGRVGDGVKQAIAIALAHDESFRVVSISTPNTVYTDVVGRGVAVGGRPQLPENKLVPAAMLHRSLRA